MKRFLILFIAIWALISCRKTEVQELFDASPEARAGERLAELQNKLVSGVNGWKGVLTTSLGGGYSFYVKFNEDNTIQMLSDINSTTSGTMKASTYRTKWVMDASLIFDTYNYISLLSDPGAKVPGATAANGLQSDVEFEYVRSSQDTVFLKGKRYKNNFVLTRLTEDERQTFINSYTSVISDNTSLISAIKFPYIQLDGIQNKISFVVDNNSKKVSAEYMGSDGEVNSIVGKFGFDIYGFTFPIAMQVGTSNFINGVIKDNKLLLVDVEGKQTEVKSNDVPILPILTTFGYNKANKRITSDAIPGVTANVHIFNKVRELFTASGRNITSMYFAFTNSTTAIFYIGYSSGTSAFVASASYQYTQDGNKLKLKRIGIDGGNNWNTRAVQVAPVDNLFGTGDEREFLIDWVSSQNATIVYPIAGIISASNPLNMLYGKLGN